VRKIKSKYLSRTHKYGVRIPKSMQEAIEIDKESNTTLWWNSVMLEMNNVMPTFEVFEKIIEDLPIDYTQIKWHVIWNVKLGDNFKKES